MQMPYKMKMQQLNILSKLSEIDLLASVLQYEKCHTIV